MEALTLGEIRIVERLFSASNATFVVEAHHDGAVTRGVYKPVRGEQPLWDFPDGTLARREVAAYAVSEALGWNIVPLTVLGDGPVGPGMLQVWVEAEPVEPVRIVPVGRVPSGYHHVVDAYDAHDREVSLVHEDCDALLRMAVFDVIVNNTDRKAGHILPTEDGHRYGIDHGVTFHTDPKLRTVLWGWADRPVPPELVESVLSLTYDNDLLAELSELLSPDEVHAFVRRSQQLARRGRMPNPSESWRAFPWPIY